MSLIKIPVDHMNNNNFLKKSILQPWFSYIVHVLFSLSSLQITRQSLSSSIAHSFTFVRLNTCSNHVYTVILPQKVVWLLLVLNVDGSGTMHNWKKQWLLYDSYRWRWTETMYNVWELWLCYGLVWKIIFIHMTQGGSDKTQWKHFRTYLNLYCRNVVLIKFQP